MRNVIILCLLLMGCASKGPNCPCDCHMNDDGTMNFKVDVIGNTMMIKSGGESYIKENMSLVAGELPEKERYFVWRSMKDGTRVRTYDKVEALESCSLLYKWKQKAYDKFMYADTGAVVLKDTAF